MGGQRPQHRGGVQHLVALLTASAASTAPRPWSLRSASYRLAAAPFLFLAALFVLPLLRVVVQAFQHAPAAPDNFTRIATSGPYMAVLLGTVQTACVVTVVCLLLAYPLAYAGARLQGRWHTLFMGTILVPLFTSVVVRSYAWMVLFQRNGPLNQALIWLDWPGAPVRLLQTPFAVDVGMVDILLPFMVLPILGAMRAIDPTMVDARLSGTFAAIVLAHTVIAMPFVFITVRASLQGYSPALEQAAMTMGANGWVAFRRVTLPMVLLGVLTGAVFAFTASFDELMLSLFLTTPETNTLPRVIWAHLAFQLSPDLAAVATLVLVVSCLLVAVSLVLRRRGAAIPGLAE